MGGGGGGGGVIFTLEVGCFVDDAIITVVHAWLSEKSRFSRLLIS